MNLKQLQYFVTVVDEGNITAAAKKLFMSQPPLSVQIKLLEEEFGCILLIREPRQVKLTEAGKMLYDHAVNLLELSKITKAEVLYAANKNNGTIRVGIVSSLVCTAASRWIQSFMKKYTDIKFEITEGNTYTLLEKLHANIIHIAIIRTPFHDENVICEKLFSDTVVAVGKRKFFNSDNKSVKMEELSQKPIIIYRRWEQIIRKMFNDNLLELNYRCLNDDARTTVYFAEQGMGIGLIPESAAELITHGEVVCKKIKKCSIQSTINLVYSPHSYMPECTKLFIEHLRKISGVLEQKNADCRLKV